MDSAHERLLRDLALGKADPFHVVEQLGGNVSEDASHLDLPADLPVVEVTVSDLAEGLLSNQADAALLKPWAMLVLAISEIELAGEGGPNEDRLLNVLWDAAAGEPMGLEDAAFIRGLVA